MHQLTLIIRAKDLGIKLADPSKLALPRRQLGTRSCVLVVDIKAENPGQQRPFLVQDKLKLLVVAAKALMEAGAIKCGEVIIGVGSEAIESEGKTTWFDLRPLQFTEAYCVIRTIIEGSDTFYFVLQRNAYPVGVGCETPVPTKVELKRPSSGQQRTETPKKMKSETKRSEKKSLVWDKRSFTKVYTVAKETEQNVLGIVLSEARTKNNPIWLPPSFRAPVMNFPFVSAVYNNSCLKQKVRPGDALLEVNGKNLSRVGIDAAVQKLSQISRSSATLTFGRPADMSKHIHRFERLYLQGKGGTCLIGSPLPRLSSEIKKFATSEQSSEENAFTPSRKDVHSVVKKRQRQTQSARSLVRSLEPPDSASKSIKNLPALRTPSYSESKIRVGPDYQAVVREFTDVDDPSIEQDWDPQKITAENRELVEAYTKDAQNKQQVSIDVAMKILHKLDYNFQDARAALAQLAESRRLPPPKFVGTGFALNGVPAEGNWSKQDLHAFTLAMYRLYKRDFAGVQKFMRAMGSSKSRKEIVDYYYGHWKLSR